MPQGNEYNFPEKVVLPNLDERGSFTAWVYDVPGEPAFELKFSFDAKENVVILDVTPMNIDGVEAKSVRIVAR